MSEHRLSVFLSYARADGEPFIQRLYEDLTRNEIEVWWDRAAMQCRGRTFLQEIRDAIEATDRVIAVVSPHAVASEYVRYEWQHALLFCKGVVPILRQGEYGLIPEELRDFHCPDYRQERPHHEALKELLRVLREPVPKLGPIVATPALPAYYLPRRADIVRLQQILLADIHRPVVITSAQQTAALQGMGGIGKSVLAAAFARAVETRRACHDGVIWLHIGQDPGTIGLLSNLKLLGLSFADEARFYADEQSARVRIPKLLADKTSLIVLDDVWDVRHLEPIVNALGPRCRVLITTRDGCISTALGAEEVRLDVLMESEALALLADWSGQSVGELPLVAKEVARECGNLPLALAMIGAMVRDNPDRWNNALQRLRRADLEKIERQFPNYPYRNLLRVIQVSVDVLEPEQQRRYLDLAVFPRGTAIPEITLQTLWEQEGLNEYDAEDLIDAFQRRSLARRDSPGHITLHDLQFDYVRKQSGDLQTAHQRLLAAYHKRCPRGWATGPNDSYFYENLLYHMIEAGYRDAARGLLLSYDWLEAKLRATSVSALVADCAAFPGDRDVEILKGALDLSAWVLNEDATQLSGQLFGRLWDTGRRPIESIRQYIADGCSRPWLRPRTGSLAQSEGPLRRLLWNAGHVTAMAVTSDGRHVVTIGGDVNSAELKIWDLESVVEPRTISWRGWPGSGFVKSLVVSSDGKRAVACAQSVSRGGMRTEYELALLDLESCIFRGTMHGHTGSVNVIAMTTDGRYVVSASEDRTIRVWDWEGGTCLHVLEGHSGQVNALEVAADQRRVVSAADDGTLKIWDIHNGTLLHSLGERGVVGPICALAITPDATLAVSGATRKNYGDPEGPYLRVWNIDTGVLVHTLSEHNEPVCAIAVDTDSTRVFSGSQDNTVKVWNLKTGRLIRTLRGHDGAVTTIGVSPDGRRAMTASRDNTCKIWDLETGDLVHSFSNPMWSANLVLRPLGWTYELPAFTVRMTRQGPIVASISGDDSCRLWNLQAAEASDVHTAQVTTVALTCDGRYAVSVADDGTLRIWDATSGSHVSTFRGSVDDAQGLYPKAVALSPKGSRVCAFYAVPYSRSWKLLTWDLETLTTFRSTGKAPEGDRRSPIAAESREPYRTILLESHSSAPFHASLGGVSRIAVTSDGRYAVIHGDARVHVCDLESGAWQDLDVGAYSARDFVMAQTVHGLRGVSRDRDGQLRLWDLESRCKLEDFPASRAMGDILSLLADGRQLLCGSYEGTIHILDLPSGRVLFELHGHQGEVHAAAVSIENGLMASVSADRTLKVWDPTTGDCMATFTGDTKLTCVAGVGRLFAAGSTDGAVHIVELVE